MGGERGRRGGSGEWTGGREGGEGGAIKQCWVGENVVSGIQFKVTIPKQILLPTATTHIWFAQSCNAEVVIWFVHTH